MEPHPQLILSVLTTICVMNTHGESSGMGKVSQLQTHNNPALGGGGGGSKENLVTLFMCCKNGEKSESESLLFDKEKAESETCTWPWGQKDAYNNLQQKKMNKKSGNNVKWIWNVPRDFMSNGEAIEEETMFSLEHRPWSCKHDFHFTLFPENLTEPNKNGLFLNGYLRIDKDFYAQDEYCIERVTEERLRVKVCAPECGESRACIPKCCEIDKVYNIGVKGPRGCQKSNTPFNPPLYTDLTTKLSPQERKLMPQSHYFLWKLKDFKHNCYRNATTLIPLSEHVARNISISLNRTFHSGHFRIRKDGAVLYKNGVDQKCSVELEPKKVLCFDGVQDYSEDPDGFENRDDEFIIFLCTAWNVEDLGTKPSQLIYGIIMLVVSIFPLMTCLVYISLWKRMNVHGWTIGATTGSLFFMYLFYGVAVLIGGLKEREHIENTFGCIIIAIFAHFFFLAAFSWMTVMCCDLWWTFRSLQPTNRRSKGRKRYLKYSLFGWGLPLAFVITGIFLDFSHSPDDCTFHTLPGYGTHSCYILPNSQGVYIIYPVAVLLSINMVFFGVTCYKLLQYRKNTRVATKRETDHWKGFTRFAKLFLVMGVSWVFEVVSWSIDGLTLKWYWVILDMFNILRAIGVFLVYVCKQDILTMLEDNHPSLKKVFRPFRRKCSNDFMEQTGSTTAAVIPISLETVPSNFRMKPFTTNQLKKDTK